VFGSTDRLELKKPERESENSASFIAQFMDVYSYNPSSSTRLYGLVTLGPSDEGKVTTVPLLHP
jgi:hypothetical protein